MSQHPKPIWSEWWSQVRTWRNECTPVLPRYYKQAEVHPYAFMRMLSNQLPENAIIVTDCGGNQVVAAHSIETKKGQTWFTNNGNSPMGFSLCGAMGAHYAAPDRPVICIIGDGGMQVNIQELQTIKHNNVPIKVVLLNNGIYGITSQYQRTNFEDRQIGSGSILNPGDYSTPDFYKIAKGYGLTNYSICTTNESVRPHVGWLLNLKTCGILEVSCPGFSEYLPRISGHTSIDRMEEPR